MPIDRPQANAVLGPSVPLLKATVRHVVQRSGGFEAVAELLGKNKGRLHEFCSMDHDCGPSPWQVVEMEAFAGSFAITSAMASMHGQSLVPMAAGCTAVSPDVLARTAIESGEAVSAIAGLLQGITGKVSAGQKADAIREITEAITVLQSVLRGISEGKS